MGYNLEDTIAAISTPLGEGGIGIVRISGGDAFSITQKILKLPRNKKVGEIKNRYLYYGFILSPETGEEIDEVLVSFMKAPHTYTREDVVEINSHGGSVVLSKILKLVLTLGARLAEPGEFTYRAFINGRIDLAQAEAVLDIIRAKTEKALKIAFSQLKGNLSKEVGAIYNKLINWLAYIEADIDYPEEDISPFNPQEFLPEVLKCIEKIKLLLAEADEGKILREGINTVILGRPNVGKSSLLNNLLGEPRAIVTSVPGTTRDRIEEYINLKGIPLRIIDTAGIRTTCDPVESIGVEKALEAMQKANLVLYLIDSTQDFHNDDIALLTQIKHARTILVINKIDLSNRRPLIPKGLRFDGIVETSQITGEGLDKLEDNIIRLIYQGKVSSSLPLVSNLRHKEALIKALKSLDRVIETINKGFSSEFIALDLRASLEALGEITGSCVGEEVLEAIFSNFCVGK